MLSRALRRGSYIVRGSFRAVREFSVRDSFRTPRRGGFTVRGPFRALKRLKVVILGQTRALTRGIFTVRGEALSYVFRKN